MYLTRLAHYQPLLNFCLIITVFTDGHRAREVLVAPHVSQSPLLALQKALKPLETPIYTNKLSTDFLQSYGPSEVEQVLVPSPPISVISVGNRYLKLTERGGNANDAHDWVMVS